MTTQSGPPPHHRTRQKDDQPRRSSGRGPRKQPPARTFVTLLHDCETTGKVVEYEVPSDVRTVKDLWSRTLKLTCPHCGEIHDIPFRSAFVRGALASGPEALLGSDSSFG